MAVSPRTRPLGSLNLRLSLRKIEMLLACVSKEALLVDWVNPRNELRTAPGTWGMEEQCLPGSCERSAQGRLRVAFPPPPPCAVEPVARPLQNPTASGSVLWPRSQATVPQTAAPGELCALLSRHPILPADSPSLPCFSQPWCIRANQG